MTTANSNKKAHPFIITQSLHKLRHEKCHTMGRIRFQNPKHIGHHTWMTLICRSKKVKSFCYWTSSPMRQLLQQHRIFIYCLWRDKICQCFRYAPKLQYMCLPHNTINNKLAQNMSLMICTIERYEKQLPQKYAGLNAQSKSRKNFCIQIDTLLF